MANADPRSGGRGASSRPRGGLSSSHNVAWTTKCDTEVRFRANASSGLATCESSNFFFLFGLKSSLVAGKAGTSQFRTFSLNSSETRGDFGCERQNIP